MARPAFEEDEEKPLDPAVEKVRRKLVRFVAINLGLLFLALMAVVAALVYKSLGPAQPEKAAEETQLQPTGEVAQGRIPVPSGARIVSQSLSGNRISMDLELPDGSRAIQIYDVQSMRAIARFAVVEE
ncbi:fimbrial protein [Mesorhizobium marinum]|uniref:fimbrial protein n=1 Tax=Mesorhizobium marinum TaxID=3228790 RepID=UPI00346707E9